jgi:hypothetical protein
MVIQMPTLLLALGLAWGATLGYLWWRTRFPFVKRRVLINCADDTAVRGILIDVRGDWLEVQQAELMRPDGAAAALDGQTLIPRARVLFLQVLP